LILARILGVLPPRVFLLGCQQAEQGLGMGLNAQVEEGVTRAVEELGKLVGPSPPGVEVLPY
jgi:hypothetical protein